MEWGKKQSIQQVTLLHQPLNTNQYLSHMDLGQIRGGTQLVDVGSRPNSTTSHSEMLVAT